LISKLLEKTFKEKREFLNFFRRILEGEKDRLVVLAGFSREKEDDKGDL
jgi:hypothetical protein